MPVKLHVEVVRKFESSALSAKDLSTVIKSELKRRNTLTTGTKITDLGENLADHVEAINICELEATDENDTPQNSLSKMHETVNVHDISLALHMFRLNKDGAHSEMLGGEGDEVAAMYWSLPNREYHGIWDSLIFDSNIKEKLLQYCWAMAAYSEAGVNSSLVASNRVVLLHGPPGTGKTSLCKALASKLAVRMSSSYDQTILVEVNTHSLFSKFFSESGKLVTKMFQKINEVVDTPMRLVCVLIDEVESLAHSRAAAAAGTEPSDSFRVVNSVLTQLDLLKMKPNVLILTTSNITGAIDVAFVDRADIKQYIPQPSTLAIYSIIYSCIAELIRVGMVMGPLPERIRDPKGVIEPASHEDPQVLLVKLSMMCGGLSGRSLRKMPLLAHSYYLNPSRVVSLPKFLKAMMEVVASHKSDLEIILDRAKPV